MSDDSPFVPDPEGTREKISRQDKAGQYEKNKKNPEGVPEKDNGKKPKK